jgi:aerobic C4-dicarboxylate transport protein
VPIAGVALLVGIDRFMSEARALTSFIGNAVASVVISRWEHAVDLSVLRDTLAAGPAAGIPAPPSTLDDPVRI